MDCRTRYLAGLGAEAQVAESYVRAGYRVLETRWRGPAGEIDLILSGDDGLVFVEVKKSRTHDGALARVLPRQLARIQASAEDYASRHAAGQLTPMRIDIATVDAAGRISVLENASML